jgi:hypothetical protein
MKEYFLNKIEKSTLQINFLFYRDFKIKSTIRAAKFSLLQQTLFFVFDCSHGSFHFCKVLKDFVESSENAKENFTCHIIEWVAKLTANPVADGRAGILFFNFLRTRLGTTLWNNWRRPRSGNYSNQRPRFFKRWIQQPSGFRQEFRCFRTQNRC